VAKGWISRLMLWLWTFWQTTFLDSNLLLCWEHLRGLPLADEWSTDATYTVGHWRRFIFIRSSRWIASWRSGRASGYSLFGWVLSGNTTSPSFTSTPAVHAHYIQAHSELDVTLQRFWEAGEIPSCQLPSEENVQCENHFRETHSRLAWWAIHSPYSVPFSDSNWTDSHARRASSLFARKKACIELRQTLTIFCIFAGI